MEQLMPEDYPINKIEDIAKKLPEKEADFLLKAFRYHQEKSFRDNLTGLYNRSFFNETLRKGIARSDRERKDLGLILLDLDDFKKVNDTFGHLEGDRVLQETAKALKDISREEDTICRYGGEEIAIILPNTDFINTQVVAERFRKSIENKVMLPNGKYQTASLGVSNYLGNSNNFEELIKQADDALYLSKKNGKNRVSAFCKNQILQTSPAYCIS